ncbi:D-sedoheptulose 7-phosphate isomerase [Hymenobacter seoulensis]
MSSLSLTDQIQAELTEAQAVLNRFLQNPANLEAIAQAARLMADSLNQGGKILTCGNGGSLCDAQHFAEELTGRYRENRRALAALALTEASHMSCVANDFGYDHVFARFVEGLGRPGDVLLAISTSGNSPNILLAAEAAKTAGMKVVSLTGKDGGKLACLSDVEIRAPHSGYADRIQEIHIKAIHIMIMLIEQLVK